MIGQLDAGGFRRMMISAANNIENNRQPVNDLNVFPVPDGDTGTNMSLTMAAAAREMATDESTAVGQTAEKLAGALLRGARGNSGVILSLLWRGFARQLKGMETIGPSEFAAALLSGVEAAYKAVMKPTEGTILTVARLSAEYAVETADSFDDVAALLSAVIEKAKEILEKTPDMLPVLKQAGVVDAGGMGLVIIYEGALSCLKTGEIISLKEGTATAAPAVARAPFASIETESIRFTYCTEFIVKKGKKKKKDANGLSSYLESIGDSLVLVEDDEIIKVHVHTNNPGNALQRGLMYGTLSAIKIDNMKEQHTGLGTEPEQDGRGHDHAHGNVKDELPPEPEKRYGFVAVAAGEGLSSLFSELGADRVVSGGQTMNPSTDEIAKAVLMTPAEVVFVLPNNKNIIMAAEQAAPLCPNRQVRVIATRQIPQGITAMLSFDETAGPDENTEAMNAAVETVKTGQITFAARDSSFDGHDIKKGQYLGLIEGKMAIIEDDADRVLRELSQKLCDGCELITLYYGADVSKEEGEQAAAILREVAPSAEVTLVSGGQPVYYYIISAE